MESGPTVPGISRREGCDPSTAGLSGVDGVPIHFGGAPTYASEIIGALTGDGMVRLKPVRPSAGEEAHRTPATTRADLVKAIEDLRKSLDNRKDEKPF